MRTYAESGDKLTLTVAAGCAVGDPLILGQINCVAETLAAAGADASVGTKGAYWLSVKGVDDAGNSSISVGDQIYFVAAETPKLSKKESGNFFGWALDAVAAAETKTIRVLLGGAGVGVLDSPTPALMGQMVVATKDFAGGHSDWTLTRLPVAAVGTITLTGVPTINQTFKIDTQTFIFLTARGLKGDVKLGATAAACCTNMIAAINADMPSVTASQGAGTTVVITVNQAGSVGNALVFTEACTNFAMDGSGVLGGTTAGVAAVTSNATIIRTTNAAVGSANIIAVPTDGKSYWIYNGSGQDNIIKASGQTGVTVATGKFAIVCGNGTDFVRVTADC